MWFGPGWYFPLVFYPDIWYWNGWMGYYFYYPPIIEERGAESGLRFDLRLIPSELRKFAEDGIIKTYDGKEWVELGFVGKFLHKTLPLDPGTYDLKVVFPDDREFNAVVGVKSGPTYIALRLDKPATPTERVLPSEEEQLIPATVPSFDRPAPAEQVPSEERK